jgi:hypothetical protein
MSDVVASSDDLPEKDQEDTAEGAPADEEPESEEDEEPEEVEGLGEDLEEDDA